MSARGRKRGERGGVHSADEAVQEFLAASGLGAKLRDWPVYEAWRNVLGEDLARRARAVDFRRGELVIEVESATHMHELSNFTGEQYRRRVNQELGRETVHRLSFKLRR